MLPAYLAPRTWPTWIGLGLFRLIALLPHKPALRFGAGLGALVYALLPPSRKRVLTTNLALCFPELSAGDQRKLAWKHARHMGMSGVETAFAWWADDERLRRLGHIEGLEHLRGPLAEGKGIILLTAHFTALEIGGHLLGLDMPLQVIYRRHENPAAERAIRRGRERHAEKAMHRDDIKTMIRSLRGGRIVWYAPDQNYKKSNKVFAPFFGIQAATNPATTRLAAITGAVVVPFVTYRRSDLSGYDVRIEPALEDFPGTDATADATRINAIFERWAREQPADYYWLHRRFKTRPPGEPPIYR